MLGFAEVCEVKLVVTVVDLWFWKLLRSELCSAMSSMALGGAVEANLAVAVRLCRAMGAWVCGLSVLLYVVLCCSVLLCGCSRVSVRLYIRGDVHGHDGGLSGVEAKWLWSVQDFYQCLISCVHGHVCTRGLHIRRKGSARIA